MKTTALILIICVSNDAFSFKEVLFAGHNTSVSSLRDFSPKPPFYGPGIGIYSLKVEEINLKTAWTISVICSLYDAAPGLNFGAYCESITDFPAGELA